MRVGPVEPVPQTGPVKPSKRAPTPPSESIRVSEGFEQALAEKFGFVLPHLNERQRRLLGAGRRPLRRSLAVVAAVRDRVAVVLAEQSFVRGCVAVPGVLLEVELARTVGWCCAEMLYDLVEQDA